MEGLTVWAVLADCSLRSFLLGLLSSLSDKSESGVLLSEDYFANYSYVLDWECFTVFPILV